jgi:hypothetical protein
MGDPTWIVWHPDGGEDGPEQGKHYQAVDAEFAAEKWAEDYDKGDYTLTQNEDCREIVKVMMVANDPVVRTFAVRAAISVDYYADELFLEDEP